MADDDRTEHPTARRLRKAVEDGQMAHSADLSSAVVTVSAMGLFVFMGHQIFSRLADLFASGFKFDVKSVNQPETLIRQFGIQLFEAFIFVAPLFVFTLVVAVVANGWMSGFHFSPKASSFKFAKLNPVNGLKRIFGVKALVELGKSILKFALVSGILWLCIKNFMDDLFALGHMELQPALAATGHMLTRVGLWVSLGLVLIALMDVPYQKYTYIKQLKMTRQEVKDEMKNAEGNPEIKAKIKQRQREIANAKMIQRVKDADVVITNPEHFAVALEYDPMGDGAPILVAKGVDLMAARIREEAEKHGIQIFQAPPLARALYFTTEPEHPIPEELYHAVAQVIAYVFSLEGASPMGGHRAPPMVKVPASMMFNPDGSSVQAKGAMA